MSVPEQCLSLLDVTPDAEQEWCIEADVHISYSSYPGSVLFIFVIYQTFLLKDETRVRRDQVILLLEMAGWVITTQFHYQISRGTGSAFSQCIHLIPSPASRLREKTLIIILSYFLMDKKIPSRSITGDCIIFLSVRDSSSTAPPNDRNHCQETHHLELCLGVERLAWLMTAG